MRTAIVLAASLAIAAAPAAERVPAPEPLPADAQVLGYAVIPSLPTLLDHAEAAASAFMPLPKGMLAAQASGTLGDPGFANLDASRPIVVMVLAGAEAGDPPEVSAWIPAKDPAKYVASAAAIHAAGAVAGTRAVLAQTPEAVARAQGLAAAVDALAAPKSDLRLRVAADRVMAKYHETFETRIDDLMHMMATMPHPPGAADPSAILGLELRGIMAFAHDVRDCQVDLTLGESVAADGIVAAVEGSPLAKALVAPKTTGAKAASLIGPGEGGVMTVVGAYDGRAAGTYLAQLLRQTAAKPGATPIDDRILAFLDDLGAAFDGEFAMRMTVDADGKLGAVGATGVASPEASRRMYEGLSALTADDGPIGKLYADLGIPLHMRFETGVRQSGDAQVDRMTMDLDASKLPAEQARAMAAMMRPWEFVRTAQWNLTSEDPAGLDRLVARSKEAAPAGSAHTAAEDAIGADRDLYLDYDFIGLMRASLSGAAAGPGAEVMKPMLDALAALPPEPPILGAATVGGGALRSELRLPLKAFADFAKAMQQVGQPKRQGGRPAKEGRGGKEF